MSEQTIFRIHREERDRWTMFENEILQDPEMTFKATGLLVYLLSKPMDWIVQQTQLANAKKDGRDSMLSGFNELRKLGYIHKEIQRDRGMIIGVTWHVYERPRPITDFPESVKPKSDKPISGNPTLQRNEDNKGLKITKTAEEASAELSSKLSKKGKASSFESIEFPEALRSEDFMAVYREWFDHRAAKKAKLTPQAIKLQLKQCEAWGHAQAIAAIQHSIQQGYTGIYQPNARNHAHQKSSPQSPGNAGTLNASVADQY